MKTAEEILIENGISITQDGNEYMKYGCTLNKIKKAMEEYAALKVAEDRAEHMILEVKTTPTDKDIEKWAKDFMDERMWFQGEDRLMAKHYLIIAVKAALNGEILKK